MKECTTHHHACACREARFAQIEAENAKLREAIESAFAAMTLGAAERILRAALLEDKE